MKLSMNLIIAAMASLLSTSAYAQLSTLGGSDSVTLIQPPANCKAICEESSPGVISADTKLTVRLPNRTAIVGIRSEYANADSCRAAVTESFANGVWPANLCTITQGACASIEVASGYRRVNGVRTLIFSGSNILVDCAQ